jgi:low temperature requirement protein LtrA
MMVLVVMAVNAHHGLDQSAIGFALSYVAFRTILVLQYLVAGVANPAMRGMIRHFCLGFTVSILLWASSIFVTGPLRFGLWILGLVIDFATPLSGGRYVAKFPPSMSHVPERMGLFTIIVLGESLFAAIGGLSKQESWTVKATSMAVLGLVNAFSLWWMYFETASGSPLLGLIGMGFLFAIGVLGHGLSALTVVGCLALVGVIQILVDVLGQLHEAA